MASLLDGLVPDPTPAITSAGVEGHRQRLRARLLAAGPDGVTDNELLELVLFLALPRRDTKPTVQALLSQFGGFASVITAPERALREVDGLGEAGVAALKTVLAAALRLGRA